MNESPQPQVMDYERMPTTPRPGLSTKAHNPRNLDYQRKRPTPEHELSTKAPQPPAPGLSTKAPNPRTWIINESLQAQEPG